MTSNSLYYYTSTQTMSYIMQNANIFATNLKYMNDSEEYVNGLIELRKLINTRNQYQITEEALAKRLAEDPDSYSISFTKQRDLLSQWSMYAKESGVSLRMKFDQPYTYLISERYAPGDRIICTDYSPEKVYYFTSATMPSDEYDKVSDEIGQELLWKPEEMDSVMQKDIEANVEENIWEKNIPYIKRYEFKAEEEYRLVFRQKDWDKAVKIGYRLDKNVLKPYLDVTCEGGWPIREVIVGPGFNQQAVFESVRHFFQNAVLKLPELSDIEFRDRCEDYLRGYSEIDDKMWSIWNKENVNVTGDKTGRFLQWIYILKYIEEAVGNEFKEYIMNRYFAKEGIVLSKSSIPYIY